MLTECPVCHRKQPDFMYRTEGAEQCLMCDEVRPSTTHREETEVPDQPTRQRPSKPLTKRQMISFLLDLLEAQDRGWNLTVKGNTIDIIHPDDNYGFRVTVSMPRR